MNSEDLPKAYDPKKVEEKWLSFWENNDFFKADPNSERPPYCIVMPPPNVTGALHMGHALVNTLQDILIRWKRMCGYEVLWIPGTDHAGISTQMVVEKHLLSSEGKRRKDFSREEFLSHVWKWKDEYEKRIIGQLTRLGCSCDWSRKRFTMDEGNNKAVRATFKKLYDQGLIYRGDYLVNWDPVTQTALSDDEVEYEDRESFLWYLKFPFEDGSGYAIVATTRPETMLGDTAVAVSPKDSRYSHLVGKNIDHPLTGRKIPLIADPFVDPAFGTGMVKLTPAHDPNDYQMAHTHNLPMINIMTPDGKINENGGQFKGMSMAEAREAVIEHLKEKGFLLKVEPHLNRVGVSYRSKAIIEPYLSKQWFIRMGEFGRKLGEAVRSGYVKLIPQSWENTYFHWIDHLRDWCISRQLWWGHRIPIWYNRDNPDLMICHDGEDMPPEVRQNPSKWMQDEDVLDTWFSAALWPFSTLGWPNETAEFKKFYPNSVLVTGHDILFFWVARMLLMGEYITGHVPFPDVFLHGLIYGKSYWRNLPGGGIRYVDDVERKAFDNNCQTLPSDVQSRWEKMSKTKGNVIDPLEIIDTYGTDAMRMALCASPSQLRQIDLDRRRFEEFKNFANKVWNGARFVFLNLDGDSSGKTTPLSAQAFSKGLDETLFTLEDRWILSALNRVIKDVNAHLEAYEFDQAAIQAYDFFWKEFCAYYLEIAKPILFGKAGTHQLRENKQKLLVIILCNAIRLLHPMAPFITEELFSLLKKRLEGIELTREQDVYTQITISALQGPSCSVVCYPQVIREQDIDTDINETFGLLEDIVYTIRNIRGEMKLSPGTSTDIFLLCERIDPKLKRHLEEDAHIIPSLIPTKQLQFIERDTITGLKGSAMVKGIKILIPLPSELQVKEKERLKKEHEKLLKNIERADLQMQNSDFMAKAPPALIEKLQLQMDQAKHELQEIQKQLSEL